MTDKERILTHIIQILTVHEMAYHNLPNESYFNRLMLSPPIIPLERTKCKIGDISVAMSSGVNRWTVGAIHDVKDNYVIIREFGTGQLCKYYNEAFFTFDRKNFSRYELLEGRDYKIYTIFCKCLRDGPFAQKDFDFDDDHRKVNLKIRKKFTDECCASVDIDTTQSLKSIKMKIDEWLIDALKKLHKESF